MARVKVSMRLDQPIYVQVKQIADDLGWTLSDVLRYLVSVSYVMLRPDVLVSLPQFTKYIWEEGGEDEKIEAWKIVKFIVPRAVREIEKFEEELRSQVEKKERKRRKTRKS